MTAYLNIDLDVKDDTVIETARKIVEDHFYHWCNYKSIKKTQKYELKRQFHHKLKKFIYSLYMCTIIGSKQLLSFDYVTNIYRPNIFLKIGDKIYQPDNTIAIGNIDKSEYIFVNGQISNYYD